MVVVHIDRDCFAVFAGLQTDSGRRMNLFFHAVLLRENACSYSQVYQKEQRPFNLRSAHGASWVGSSNRSASNLRYATRSMYRYGQGVPQNDAEAVKWFRLAAEQGIAGAQANLGLMYFNGQGIRQNYAEAAKWFRL